MRVIVLSGGRVSNFKVEVVCSSETLIHTCQTVRHHVPEDRNFKQFLDLLSFHLDEIHCHPGSVQCVGG